MSSEERTIHVLELYDKNARLDFEEAVNLMQSGFIIVDDEGNPISEANLHNWSVQQEDVPWIDSLMKPSRQALDDLLVRSEWPLDGKGNFVDMGGEEPIYGQPPDLSGTDELY